MSAVDTTGFTGGSGVPVAFCVSLSISVIAASASAWRPCTASQRGDSGSRLRSASASSAGSAPMTNMYCQPRCGTTHNPARLAATRPIGNTSSYNSTKRPRPCAFASSLMKTAATGTSPPSPMPWMVRSTSSES